MNEPLSFDYKKVVRSMLLFLMDIVLINLCSFAALLLRMETNWQSIVDSGFLTNLTYYAPLHTLVTLALFWLFRLYSSLWEYASTKELLRITAASALACLLQQFGMYLMQLPIPRSFPVINFMLLTASIGATRLFYRTLRSYRHQRQRRAAPMKRTMLIGAGDAGALALREFQISQHSTNKVVCVIDDDPRKKGQQLRGVPVVGGRSSILSAAEKYRVDEIVLAMPSASPSIQKEILTICQETRCSLLKLPGIYQLANGDVAIQKFRKVQIEDLLGRETVHVDMAGIGNFVGGKVVLVTGGGGSIGSELCRQLAKFKPARLIIFDIYENNAYDIQQELRRDCPDLELTVLIGSVRDRNRLENVFRTYRPELVYHAAAHKHVPLMEDSPAEAIKNNVFGTYNVAQMADQYGTKRFLLISTDKAVNPTNVMGASKRICERVIQMVGRNSKTEFVAVRFGNVLGSNGSVIPLFKKQIAAGGPVTVTDKRVIRYFMTIPEAVSLVLQAGVFAKGGEIFILDMGDPVKIDDLARNMIRLSGLEPDIDIPIVYTGLRPGEKLFEEILLSGEENRKTKNNLIYIGKDEPFDDQQMLADLEQLSELVEHNQDPRPLIHRMVPEFKQPK